MDIESLLRASAENMASDIHVRAGGPPYLRVDGDLIPVDVPALTPEDSERLAFALMTEEQSRVFRQTNEIDFAYTLDGVGRFRVNVFRQRGLVGVAIRRVLPGIASFEALGLPQAVAALAEERRGLVLVTGMTGSGKSEFIMTFILSLAVNYHPDEVAFILIDYKGGGMANAFTDLPHDSNHRGVFYSVSHND